MARLKDSTIEAVKAAADIVDVVSARTQLRKSGARHTGRCPFHEERTPSFSVNATDKLFYCFGCGKGGDLIRFVEDAEQLDFNEAVEWLADRYRVPLEYEEASPRADENRRRKERLLALLERATAFYERYLWESKAGDQARGYLAERGLGEAICREFRLGLSPGGGRLASTAREKGFSTAELRGAGLLGRRGDYFQHRLMFPLADARGRVVGFSARKLREDDPLRGKYVNSPEGELFRKSEILYGFHLARVAIGREARVVVVEGNTDAIALRQAGVETAVAALGTALTEQQLRRLPKGTRLYLCFDADAAGATATLRGMELAIRLGFDVDVVRLEPGLDPADAAQGFDARLEKAESYPVYRVRLEIERSLPDRQEAFARVRTILGGIPNSPERQDAQRVVADLLGLPPELQAGLAPAVRAATGTVSARVLDAEERRERDALAACVAHPELRKLLAELSPEHFDREEHRRLQRQLVAAESPDAETVPLLAELAARAEADALDETTGRELLLRLRERRLERELRAASPERAKELQTALLRIRAAVGAVS